MSTRKVVTTCTRDCPNSCGLVATVEDGRLVKLQGDPDHPLTSGVACHKTAKYIKRVYSAERITHPLRKVDGRWQRATWDEVLDLIAQTMKTIVAESGPEAILYHQGYGERTALKLLNKYFFNLLGGVTFLRGSLCGGAGQGSQNLDFGNRISHDPLDHYNSNSMILWARNPVSTNISLVRIVKDIRKRGGTVVVIDPARSRSVSIADHHIAPIPGKDGYLAMAAAKLILEAGSEARDFLAERSAGYDEYKAILDRFTVPELCGLAGVTTEDAELVAGLLMDEGPTSILLGWGLHRHEYAHLAIRPIDALGAIAGTIGVPGGGVSQGFEEYGPYDQHYWGDSLRPERRTFFIGRVGEEILQARDPEVRMIYVTAGNPVCTAPNAEKIVVAYEKAELVVYSGHFLDDTAEQADIFLPATTFLEEDDLMASYGHNFLGPVNRAIDPVGESKSEFEMFYELAARFPFAEEYRRSVDEWLDLLCAPVYETQGADLATLRSGPFRLDAPMVPYEDGRFETDSGKFEFLTEFDPALLEDEDSDYPYKFLTIAPHGHICSERTMADHAPLPTVMLAGVEAAKRGLTDGGHVMVRSEFGQVMARLKVDDGLRGDVLVAERGGWNKAGHGFNLLTRDMASKVGLGTPFYETRVTLEPCTEDGVIGSNILVVQHSAFSPGGHFTKELERQGAELAVLQPFEGDKLPASPDGYDRLVVLGGPQHAFDDEAGPHFPALMQLMRDFDAAGKPVAGICLGGQLLARAHGSELWTLPALEFGFVQHALTAGAKDDPVMGGVALPPLMEFHEDSFDLPEGAELLVRGEACANQCFRVGNCSYGFQFHLEIDSLTIENWFEEFQNDRVEAYAKYRAQFTDDFFAELRSRFPLLIQQSGEFCMSVARAWLALGSG